MSEGPEDRRPPLTPALARRVAITGSLTLALFAILFFRLWFLQVLTGTQYVEAAAKNQTRSVLIAPARGEILDASGKVLVSSQIALALKIVPSGLPVPIDASNMMTPGRRDRALYDRVATMLSISTRPTRCKVPAPPPSCNVTVQHCPRSTIVHLSPVGCDVAKGVALATYADVTIKQPVTPQVEYYVAERQNQYKGVQIDQVSETHYPDTTLAAQVLGTVGQITQAQTHQRRFKGVNQNAVVGQSGLEYQYDQFLRGRFGKQQIKVNATGQPVGHGRTVAPQPGQNLQTSLNASLQRVGQQSLAYSNEIHAGDGGAFVAMNPDTGAVYAMGSDPSYDANDFSGAVSAATYKSLNSAGADFPLLNRAIQSAGPDGSTFKPITATAALESGLWTTSQTFDDTGQYCVGTGAAQQCRHNSGHASYGVVNLVSAIKVSDDDFFYNLGTVTNADPATHPDGGPLDTWARRFGIGRRTGIDLPYENAGTLPDPKWRAQRNRDEQECDDATGAYRYTNGTGGISATPRKGYHRSPKHSPGGCGIADGTDRPWSEGDNENLAVGQGDVQVTPLQLAVAYSALANGGYIVRPHIGESIENADGTVLQKIDPAPARNLHLNPIYLQTILQGLREAASAQGGTSADVMGSFNQQVYGKTGTAQYIDPTTLAETDYAWYSCFVPKTATSKPIEVVVWVEKGGFGDVGAAPVARQILSQWFNGKPGAFVEGSSTDQ